MAINKTIFFLLISGLFSLHTLHGQTDEWTKKFSKDGNIEVWHHISKRVDENGKEVMLIKYQASTIADVQLQHCVNIIRDASYHKQFLEDTEVSEEIKTYTENDWLIYFLFDARWPMPNSDCVMDMKYIVDSSNNAVRFEGTASPGKLEDKGVKRLTYYSVIYSFKEVNSGRVEIMMYSEITPVVSAPAWMADFWFPKGPAEIVERIIELAKQQ